VLEQAGVKRCYGIVGDTLNLFAEHLDRRSIDWVHVRHEEAGAFAAGAKALLTNNLTACAGSCGPGSLQRALSGGGQIARTPLRLPDARRA